MNKYEKIGRALVGFAVAFGICFAFSATCMVFMNFFLSIDAWGTLCVCAGVGAFFGLFGGLIGYDSWF